MLTFFQKYIKKLWILNAFGVKIFLRRQPACVGVSNALANTSRNEEW
jgi:hypothetical protein